MAERRDAMTRCRACIDQKRSFLLQGGAGSGKTESLKELLLYIKREKPAAQVVCITHTNAAVAEITNRVGGDYVVSTIHSFLYSLIRGYRKNIAQLMPRLFQLEFCPADDRDYKEYKALYNAYREKYFSVFEHPAPSVGKKTEYDKDPVKYNRALDQQIQQLNQTVAQKLEAREMPARFYNETSFDSFADMSFGHDGLLTIFRLFVREYPLFRKIIGDKYDYIFVDEYQDTQGDILAALLGLSSQGGPAVCLFGDHMQAIYEIGIRDLSGFISKGKLERIPKEDNYRCPYEVIELLNTLRTDGVRQTVALKTVDGRMETAADRHGSARVWYTVTDSRPHSRSTAAEKQKHCELVQRLLDRAKAEMGHPVACKVLILTNKEIARQNGFSNLLRVFSDRYNAEASAMIEPGLHRIQALEVAQLCRMYEKKQFNELIHRVKKSGYQLNTGLDLTALQNLMQDLADDPDRSMWDAVQLAVKHRLIKQTEACRQEERKRTIRNTDPVYADFCQHYQSGKNTWLRIQKSWPTGSEEDFEVFERRLKQEQFLKALFSDAVKFSEVCKYDAYLEEETEYITIHKTKGTGIRSVIVVMDEFFWTSVNFGLLWRPEVGKEDIQDRSARLLYVACSRATEDLICVRVVTGDEEAAFKARFPQAEKIELTEL